MSASTTPIARYTRWLGRHATLLATIGALVFGVSTYLIARHLPLRSDFSYLLPQDAPAVRDLRRLSERLVARDTTLVVIAASDPATRAAAMATFAARARDLPRTLVERIDDDDAGTRAFVRSHAPLLIPLDELTAARDALAAAIDREKLAANPLFVDLEDESAEPAEDAELERLRARVDAANARLARSGFVSADGRIGLVVVRTAFPYIDVGDGKRLLEELATVRAGVRTAFPGVAIGFTGGVATTVAEHEALVGGIVWSSVITIVLVGSLLALYLRSFVLLMLLGINLIVATTAAFGVAVFTVGHLNAATAFLGAIIAGNGVNYGILLIARFVEERRRHATPNAAMRAAIQRTLRPTLVASLGAAIAYGSLAATSFRGFADFAMIGALGMVLCWIASYTLLPALVLHFAGTPRTGALDRSRAGALLTRAFGFRSPRRVFAVAVVLLVLAIVVVARFFAAGPFEQNMRNLRSDGPAAAETRRWIRISDAQFGKSISGRIYVAADRPEQVPLIVGALERIDAHLPPDERAIRGVSSILDVIPADQQQRLEVLAELRALIDRLPPADRDPLRSLRPPDDLRPINVADLPTEILEQLVERDGRVGLLVAVQPGPRLDQWKGPDLIRFASAVRSIELPNGETITTSGASVIFADILSTIERDGPVVTAVAAIAIALMVLGVAGVNRRAFAVLVATGAGSILMIAVCALLGLRVNFLDFIALPITLGLGVDYAINVAHRASSQGTPEEALRTTGTTVVVCSLTTIIGYGSLLASQNLAIRGFGLASLIGEITCVTSALVLVPAIVIRRRR